MDKKTFNEMFLEVQEMVGDTNASTLVFIKKWINQAQKLFNAASKRYFLRDEKTANIVATQQFYQLPVDCIRVRNVKVDTTSDEPKALVEVQSEEEWNRLNEYASTANEPIYFFIRGKNEIGLYPTPSTNYTDGLVVSYEKAEKPMSQADYVTGTVTVANGDATITHSAAGFTAAMVGRYFKVNDDGFFYKIATYTDANNMELENVFQGSSGAGLSFTIGESSQVPDEYHESFVDYALYRYYLRQKDLQSANEFKALFDTSLGLCKELYSTKTSSGVIHKNRFGVNVFHQVDTIT